MTAARAEEASAAGRGVAMGGRVENSKSSLSVAGAAGRGVAKEARAAARAEEARAAVVCTHKLVQTHTVPTMHP